MSNITKTVRTFLSLSMALPITILMATPAAFAQQAEADDDDRLVLEEVIVTATRRSVTIRDVPLSIQAITEQGLENLGADDFEGYFRTISSLSVVDRGPGTRKYVIRGVNTGIFSGGTVGNYIDEMPVSTSGDEPDIKLFDIERVEVLKGPQGTLFGEGSMGGTIRTITNKPDLGRFEGKASLTYSDTTDADDNILGNAMVNIPIVEDVFGIRLVAYYRDMSGYINRIAQPDGVTLDPNPGLGLPPGFFPIYNTGPITAKKGINAEETTGGRISARWQINDDFRITAGYMTQKMDVDAWNYETDTAGLYKSDFTIEEPLSDDFSLSNITFEYGLNFADLLASSSWFDREKHFEQNVSAFGEAIFWPGVNLAGSATFNDFDQEYFAQEVRLVSNNDGAFQWIGGVYYTDKTFVEDQTLERDDFDFFLNFLNDTFFPVLGFPPGFAISSMNQILDQTITTSGTELSFFGEVSYAFTDRLTATAGLRHFDYDIKTVIVNNDINLLGFGLADGVYDTEESDSILKLHLQYDYSDDVMFYGLASQGFRLGGVNTAPFVPEEFESYDSDTLWNYEMGMKSSWMNDRLIFDASVYYINWDDIQLSVPVDVTRLTLNAGKANITGVEFDLVALPVEGLTLRFTAGFIDAELAEDTPGADSDGVSPGFKGDPLPFVPEQNISASAQYDWPIESWGVDGFLRADYSYTGEQYSTFNDQSISNGGEPNYFVMDAYGIFNLRTGVRGERWWATLFIDNVTDERADLLTDNNASKTLTTRNRPRTIGVTVQYQF